MPCSSRPSPPHRSRAPSGPLTDAAVLDLPSGERLAFSTDSYVVKPLRFPGGSVGPPGRPRDRQRPGDDGRAPGGALRRLRARGGHADRRAARGGGRHGRGRRRRRRAGRHGRHQGGRPRRGGRDVHHDGRRRHHPGRSWSWRRRRWRWATWCSSSGTMGDHGTAVMLARGDLALEADIASDTAPLHDAGGRAPRRGTAHPVAARLDRGAAWGPCATSWPATRT